MAPRVFASGAEKPRRHKTLLSFYCDDTSPYVAGAKAFQTFLDYCAEQGIAGESSCILGVKGHSMPRNPNAQEQAFLHQVQRAWKCGIGTHMELMTHHGPFDFATNSDPEGMLTGRGSTRPRALAGGPSRRSSSGSANTWVAVWFGCGPATSRTTITGPAAGTSWIAYEISSEVRRQRVIDAS